jgi:hypothetical protein
MTKRVFDQTVEAMAGLAFEAGSTVREAFRDTDRFSITKPGGSDNVEVIEPSVTITPRLIEQAEALLARWRKPKAWNPTHQITHNGCTYLVMLTDDGPAYTQNEALACDHADYVRRDDGTWVFQGEPFEGTVETI